MKEDVLEQLVEDYYVSKPGWFVKHNIRFKPDKNRGDYVPKKDSVHSDIDIIAVDKNHDNVHVVSCKSWQDGFKIKDMLRWIETKSMRRVKELVSDKWKESFLETIKKETGQKNFTYVIAVTKLLNEEKKLELEQKIKEAFKAKRFNVKLEILTLEQIVNEALERIAEMETNRLESTEIGRVLQLFKAAYILKPSTEGNIKKSFSKTNNHRRSK